MFPAQAAAWEGGQSGGLKAPLAEGPSQGDREPLQPDQGLPRDEEMGDFQALGA